MGRVVGIVSRNGRPARSAEAGGVEDGVVDIDETISDTVFNRGKVGCAQLPNSKATMKLASILVACGFELWKGTTDVSLPTYSSL